MTFDDTIAAISTPPGEGGISIVRISGKEAIEIADKVFFNPAGKKLTCAGANTITYGHVHDADGFVIDEVLAAVMRAPHSYTAENVVEISCHGGFVSAGKILSAVLEAGASPAAPGEFTKRAFLNGRIDLTQAESVIDIINSKTNLTHSIAVNQLGGRLSDEINKIREKLLELLSHVQVLIDYPEEDLEPLTDSEFERLLHSALEDIDRLLSTAGRGRLVQNGIMTAIVGKPNVGKSSLLNMLSGEERAIVTDIEGTTRDAIEECVSLGDIVLRLADTAGIRDTSDIIENLGVEKSKKYINDAELIIFMLDGTKPLDANDRLIMDRLGGKEVIVLINKTEDGCVLDADSVFKRFENVIMFSVRSGKGEDELGDTVKRMFGLGNISADGGNIITNVRHCDALKKAKSHLCSALDSFRSGLFQDIISIDIENAVSALGEIVGVTVNEEVVDRIFHRFCIGK